MLSKLKRLRSKSCKVQLVLELRELQFLDDRPDLTLICIELRRGIKSISSSSVIYRDNEFRCIKFDEQLLLLITLYKDTSGIFLEKTGKILLNGHSNVTNSSVLLGSIELKLNLLASNFENQKLDLKLHNEAAQMVASLSVVTSSKFLCDGDADDDGSSNMSGVSGLSSKSHSQLQDVRYGSVYNRDYAGRIDPEMSEETTDKLRTSISKTNVERFVQDANESAILIGGNRICENTTSRKSSKYVDFSGGINKNQESISPRRKHLCTCSAKDVEIADLQREVEQANRRADVAQQEQRNICAVLVADKRIHEKIVNELNLKITDATNVIDGFECAGRSESLPIQSELDNAHTTEESSTAETAIDLENEAVQDLTTEPAEFGESYSAVKEEVEQNESEIKALHKIINDLSLELNTARLLESDLKNELSVITAELTTSSYKQSLMTTDAAVMANDLAEAHQNYSILKEMTSTKDGEISELRAERSVVKDGIQKILHQHELLESLCASQKCVIAENKREQELSTTSAVETDLLKDLRVKLTIKKLSEDSLLLAEIKQLEEEVSRLHRCEAINEGLVASLDDAKREMCRLGMEKEDIEIKLASSQDIVTCQCADIVTLEEIVAELYQEMLIIQTQHSAIENMQNKMTDATVPWDPKLFPERSADMRDVEEDYQDNADIERLIMESDEAITRVKEKRGDFQHLQQSKREHLDKLSREKLKSRYRKREIPLQHALKNEFEDDLFKSDANLTVVEAITDDGRVHCNEMKGEQDSSDLSQQCWEGFERSSEDVAESNICSISDHHNDTSDGQHNIILSKCTVSKYPSLVARISSLEVCAVAEKKKFDDRIKLLLKSLGMFDDTYSNFLCCADQTDEKWEEVVRAHSDAERRKMMTLKSCLMRLSAKLTPDELYDLEDFGIFLAPRGSRRNNGLRLGSALCFV